MRIAIGADHAGVLLKQHLVDGILRGHDVTDVGANSTEPVDYPDIARAVVKRIRRGEVERGILICGTGIGMAMAAGKFPGIRAATCTDSFSAEMSRRHNDANVLCLGARVLGTGLAEHIVGAWLEALFEGGRHATRVGKLEDRTSGEIR
ncbi:MAG: ribose 5-phosphate isomerase B [Candidatus Bipolaricaulis sp.]|nr:ribose 5-phosphate isomerase B [Candidatus Bipolaricaulis sp.]